MSSPGSITLLQISDLQLGRHHRLDSEAGTGSSLDRIVKDLDRLRDAEGLRPDLVLLTGDLSEQGMDAELGQVRRFAEGLRDRLGLSTRRVVMLPGDHDINRKLCEGYFATCEGRGRKPALPYFPKYEPFAEMFARFYAGEPGIQFTEKKPWTFFEYPDLRVVVAAFNSTIADSHRPEDPRGLVGEQQIRWFVEKLRPYRERGWLRIAAIHRDILAAEAGAARQDRLDFQEMVAPWIHLVLHGYTHVEPLRWLDGQTPVPVLGIGGAGAKAPEQPPEVPAPYQIVQVFADRIEYGLRGDVPGEERSGGGLRTGTEGNSWRSQRQVHFDRAGATFEGGAAPLVAPATDLAALIEGHRAAWVRLEAHEGLFDIAPRGEDEGIERGLDLLGIFVPPKARPEGRSADNPGTMGRFGDLGEEEDFPGSRRRRGRHVGERERAEGGVRRPAGPPEPVGELVASAGAPWITVLGAPGAGKTALTRWVGLKVCAPGEVPGEALRDLVPIRVELRRFGEEHRVARAAGRSCDFFDHVDMVHRERSIDLRGEPLRKLAEAGRILWLFDGLDEVPDVHRRREIARMIAGVRLRYGGRGIVTSRIAGAAAALPVLEHAGLQTYALQDFEEPEIEAFIERWHDRAFPGAPGVAEKRKERLRRTLRESAPVRELVKNPLLLTLVALLNRGAELPRRRHRIYEEVIHLMVERWEANKHGVVGAGRLDAAQKRKLLRQIAWRMMTELPDGPGNVIEEADLLATVIGYCERELGEGSERAQETARGILDELRERNGVLVLLGGRWFGFLHRTLLEYLAASEVVARFRSHVWELESIKEVFRQHWDEEEWREVLLLIAGMLQEERPAHVVELVQAVIEKVGPSDEVYFDDEALAFAIRCLGEVRDMQQEPIRSLALALTNAIIALPRDIFLDYSALPEALRFSGAEWPGASRLYSAMLEVSTAEPDEARRRARLVAVTITPAERLSFLADALRLSYKAFDAAFVELQQVRPLSDSEARPVLELLQGVDDSGVVEVLQGLSHEGNDEALQRLIDLGERLVAEETREVLSVAAALANHGGARDAALRLWSSVERRFSDGALSTDDVAALITLARIEPRLREWVWSSIRAINPGALFYYGLAATEWRDEEKLKEWVEMAFSVHGAGSDVSTQLYFLSDSWPAARQALESLFSRLEFVQGPYTQLSLARRLLRESPARALPHLRRLMDHAHPNIASSAAEILATWPSEAAHALKRLSGWARRRGDRGADARWSLGQAARESSEARSVVLALAGDLFVQPASRLVLLRELLTIRDPDAIRLAEQIATSSRQPSVRLDAAVQLRRASAPPTTWRPVLEHLSRSAPTGAQRLEAAKALRDERRIEQLSRRAKKKQVRDQAARALDQIHLHKAILAVGKKRRARVSSNGVFAGHLEETDTGTRFTYAAEYLLKPNALPLSPTMPLRKEPYDSPGIHPFFENLLPEGWFLDVACRKLGMDGTDPFGLLLATCRDCAGSVEIYPEPASERSPASASRPKAPRRRSPRKAA